MIDAVLNVATFAALALCVGEAASEHNRKAKTQTQVKGLTRDTGRRPAVKLPGDVRGNASDIWNFRTQLPRKGLRRALQPSPES